MLVARATPIQKAKAGAQETKEQSVARKAQEEKARQQLAEAGRAHASALEQAKTEALV